MGKLFNLDSPVMVFLGKVADLMFINIITLIACIPIITIGASLTAMHYVLLKMARKEEGYLFKPFVKSFKENFKQATLCWLIILAFIVILLADIRILNYLDTEFADWMRIGIYAVGMMGLMVILYIFPMLARFHNTIRGTFKNAFLISIFSLPKTFVMLVLCCLPMIMTQLSLQMYPIVFLFGISGPAYLCAFVYSGIFKKFEPEQTQENTGDDWFIEMEEKDRKN